MAAFASGAEHALRSEHYSMVLMNSDGDDDLDVQHIRFFQSRRVDGMMLSLTSETEPSTLDLFAKLTVPAVAVDRVLPTDLGITAVQSDYRAILRWHGGLVRRKWAAFGRRRGPGRPVLDAVIQELILRMAKENPMLRKLGAWSR